MKQRPVSPLFIRAMEEGLAHGRKQDYEGWDNRWKDFDDLKELQRFLFKRLDEEILELDEDQSLLEAADVANIAMMIADVALKIREEEDA
ncbi:hypothetical protein LCGC14_1087360 [marine sediment metagenome]|uniref:dATP/dGTP diphosphohydrolase N-terminal domain-containing protein n=1 Tax=marine sediment metagenome TaxID=412755 RepID=A0A0F9PWM8_9ZZZZ